MRRQIKKILLLVLVLREGLSFFKKKTIYFIKFTKKNRDNHESKKEEQKLLPVCVG